MVLEYSNITISSIGTIPDVPFLNIKEKILGKKYNLSIAFISPTKAKEFNIKHRSKDYIPNTLSFSLSKDCGEIILCKSALAKEYKKFSMDLRTYTIYILIHSMLHLKGMTHGGTMEKEENKYLSFFTQKIITNETKHRRRN